MKTAADALDRLYRSEGFYNEDILGGDGKDIRSQGEKKALALFHRAADQAPAYKDFLAKNGVHPSKIKTIEDFRSVPPTTKKNYIEQYPLNERCFDGKLSDVDMVSASSGSTGNAVLWPRNLENEIEGALSYELIFRDIFQINKKSTLFVLSFALGNWVGGTFTYAGARLLVQKGYGFTIATPGLDETETLKIVENMSHYFDQTIIAGYPPMLKTMLENAKNRKLNLGKFNIKFMGTAEGISESWRDYVLELVESADIHTSFINLFGSADCGLMGHETPLSVLIRKLASDNPRLNKEVFGDERVPYLYNYDPRLKYIEAIEDEIAITTNTGMPLVRYNIKDNGYPILCDRLLNRFRKSGVSVDDHVKEQSLSRYRWGLPFVYIWGRKNFAGTISGVNIYTENIKAALDHREMQNWLTGRFKVQNVEDDNAHDRVFKLYVEMKPETALADAQKKKIIEHCVSTLKRVNSEFNKFETTFHAASWPEFHFEKYGHPDYFPIDKIVKSA